MESTAELQESELTVLKSIYGDDFIECPPPKAWKGAARLHEFIIKVAHPLEEHASKVYFHLHVVFPKTYPTNTYATFTIQQPIKGLSHEQVSKLSNTIHAEAKVRKGSEAVHDIACHAQDWISANVIPPKEIIGSLATEMNKRAVEEERAKREQEAAEAEHQRELARIQAEHFNEQIRLDVQRQQKEREQWARIHNQQQQTRERAESNATDSTEVPGEEDGGIGAGGAGGAVVVSEDVLTQSFDMEVEIAGIRFDTVKLFHPRKECLGMVYLADPVCEDANATLPLEVHVITFDASYYATTQGKKKLRQAENELQKLINIRHVNLLSVYAVKLTLPFSGPPKLAILLEQRPSMTLHDVLEDCDALREERATDYLVQILSGLQAIHSGELVHRGLTTHFIGLAHRTEAPGQGQSKVVKVGKAAYYMRLLDLHRSNPFGNDISSVIGYFNLPQEWLGKDALDSALVYTRSRDLHCVGIILLQMLLGLDVVDRFPDAHSAMKASVMSDSLQRHAKSMLSPKKAVSCSTILADLDSAFHSKMKTAAIPISSLTPGPKTPQTMNYNSSPEIDYFRPAAVIQPKKDSRWKDDWEELELLGRGAFGSVVKAKNKLDGAIYAVKKVKLRYPESDAKILREVHALSRLNHRSIVRYSTAWIEYHSPLNDDSLSSSESGSGPPSIGAPDDDSDGLSDGDGDESDSESGSEGTDDGMTSVPNSHDGSSRRQKSTTTHKKRVKQRRFFREGSTDPYTVDYNDFDRDNNNSGTSFPSIHFTSSGSGERMVPSDEEFSDEQELDVFDEAPWKGGRNGNRNGTGVGAMDGAEMDGMDFDVGTPNADSVLKDQMALRGLNAGASAIMNGTPNGNRNGLLRPPGTGHLMARLVSPERNGEVFGRPATPVPAVSRTLYIQMEFVERQTLKERIAEGLTEDDGWRLLQQLVDALMHMDSMGILHRDIKLTNIFIDSKGDCKVGDFGLATTSAAVDPSDVSPHITSTEADMTLEVGTRLYIAPEILSRKKGPRNHTKADMYSLGIVFFEMNYFFSTGAERIAVIENLRKPEIVFPPDWDTLRTRQRQIITWLLHHDPAERPSALDLSQSGLLPPRLEDEYFKDAIQMMAKHDSPHHQAALQALFDEPPRDISTVMYDKEVEYPEHATLTSVVYDTLSDIFRLHGAVDMEPPLLIPVAKNDEKANRALLLDRHGEVVSLPDNALVPFARLAARTNTQRIKRFHIGDIYRPNVGTGHPRVSKAAVFDIITTDLANGGSAASAEAMIIMHECLNSFPNLSQYYEIHISHSKIIDIALNRIPDDIRSAVVEIITQTRSSWAQKRSALLKSGLMRTTVDELEVLNDADDDVDGLLSRLEKVSPHLHALTALAADEIKKAIQYAVIAGVSRRIIFHPMMISDRKSLFKDGIYFEVVRRNKHSDVLATSGRYDHLISKYSAPKLKGDPVCAVGLQISLEKILVALAAFQAVSVKTLFKEQRSFGFWSPRRCDVYVVSYQPGYLNDRLEVAALLWRNNISADVMYESGLPDREHENHYDLCNREGILFTVWPRPRGMRRDQPAFRVKSILKRTEHDISRQELVGWLQQQISEQKRIDATTSGAPAVSEAYQGPVQSKDTGNAPEVQLVLPVDTKKQRKQTKQIFLDRAFEMGVQIKTAVQSGLPVIAVDVSASVFDSMAKSSNWVTDDEAYKSIAASFSTPQSPGYAYQVRESVARKRADGHRFVLLFAVRDERVALLTL